jgi:hypothetical protein
MLNLRLRHPDVALKCLAALIAIISVNTGHAAQTRKVMVTFRGDAGCIANLPRTIGVVLEGDEKNQFPAERIGSNLWIGAWTDQNPDKNFDAEGRTASIRIGGSRTDCRRSYARQDPQVDDGWVASFRFECNVQPAQALKIRGEPDVPISYVRGLPRADNDEDSRPCADYSNFPLPPKIADVWFAIDEVPRELLRIQIGSPKAKMEAPGLLVNHRSVMKYANGGDVTLDQNKILVALGVQRAEGVALEPPLFPSSAYDDDRKRLEKLIEDKKRPRQEVEDKKRPQQEVTVVVFRVK